MIFNAIVVSRKKTIIFAIVKIKPHLINEFSL
jgi:hypothetical protein